jgi:shikimate dehydrogenase
MRLFGLIGYPLSHSFSKKYFSEKFEKENVSDVAYELFELPKIEDFQQLIKQQPNLHGLNVTIPYKQAVIPFLDELDASARKVGAVNVIRFQEGKRIGYNSDYYGFKQSLQNWLPKDNTNINALVLGTGGASKAVAAALTDLEIPFYLISRNAGGNSLSYEQLQESPAIFQRPRLIINTTPLGMAPNTGTAPPIVYEKLNSEYFLYDLVYNPAETRFMQLGKEKGATVKNGLEMLHLQAEKAWEIWNS